MNWAGIANRMRPRRCHENVCLMTFKSMCCGFLKEQSGCASDRDRHGARKFVEMVIFLPNVMKNHQRLPTPLVMLSGVPRWDIQ